jgi:hypothetical protein
MKANNNVTEALQRTMALMQGELEKSTVPIQMLGEFDKGQHSRHSLTTKVRGLVGGPACCIFSA